jgi:hypothetical protein
MPATICGTLNEDGGFLNIDQTLFYLIGNRFLWEGDGKQVVLVKAPD